MSLSLVLAACTEKVTYINGGQGDPAATADSSTSAAHENCGDDIDNDGDGLTDCSDTECLGQCPGPELCNGDGVDDDGDRFTDCDDPDCAAECGADGCASREECMCKVAIRLTAGKWYSRESCDFVSDLKTYRFEFNGTICRGFSHPEETDDFDNLILETELLPGTWTVKEDGTVVGIDGQHACAPCEPGCETSRTCGIGCGGVWCGGGCASACLNGYCQTE